MVTQPPACRQPKRAKHERPCFTRGMPGHESRASPDKVAGGQRKDVRAIEGAQPVPRRVATMCVQIVGPDGFTKVQGERNQGQHFATL